MHNISEDLKNLTSIPEDDIAKFFKKLICCCVDAVLEDTLAENDISELDIGIGTLYIKKIAETNEFGYKFIPSTIFQTTLTTAIAKKASPIAKLSSKATKKNFMQAYKNLC